MRGHLRLRAARQLAVAPGVEPILQRRSCWFFIGRPDTSIPGKAGAPDGANAPERSSTHLYTKPPLRNMSCELTAGSRPRWRPRRLSSCRMEFSDSMPMSKQGRTRGLVYWRATGLALLVLGLAVTAPGRAAETQVITVDAAAPGKPFAHYWEHTFGSGRAILSLREGYREDLRAVKAVTALSYVRFHAIMHDEVGVYSEDAQGRPVYNFSYVDQIYDGLLANGVRPLVELSFMPRALASQDVRHSFWYHPIIAPPKDYRRWDDLIEAFARHLVERYGI